MLEDALLGLFVIAIIITGIAGVVLGIVAFVLVLRDRRTRARQQRELDSLLDRVSGLELSLEEARLRFAEKAAEEPAPVEPEPLPVEPEPLPIAEEMLEAVPPGKPVAAPARRDWAHIEEVVGQRWMTWVGVVALFLAAGFFVKYAFDQGWITPRTRVVLGIVLGIVLLVLGDGAVRRRMRALGQGLMGGGLAVLYVSLFASFSLYDLVPQGAAFAAMVLVTAAGMTLAVLHDAMAISFLAILGGVLTPVLLSTGTDHRDALFSYLVLLDLGVLGVALFKRWRALDVLAFVGTAALFAGWFFQFYSDPAMVPTLLWLAAFYLVFLLLPFAHHFRHRTEVPLERFVMALANAALAFGCADMILRAEHPHVLGFVALGMAACYIVLGAGARRRVPDDVRGVFGFTGLAVLFLTLSVPLHLKVHGITLAWAAEGPVLLYLGYRYRYRPVRIGAAVVVALAVFRVFAAHWPLHAGLFDLIWNKHFATAMCAPLGAAVYAVIHHRWKDESSAADRKLKLVSAIGGGLLALVILHAELGQWFYYSARVYLGRCVVPLVWAIGAMAFLGAGLRARSVHSRWAGLGPLTLAVILGIRAFAWPVGEDYLLFLNSRFCAGLAVALAVFAYSFLLRRSRDICPGREQALAQVLWWVGLAVLLALLSAEAYGYWIEAVADPKKAQWMALMSLSVVWGAYAAAVLVMGFWRRLRPLRFAALGLFAVTALKLVAVDIAGVKQVYRIVSFFVLGLLMIGSAYLYHRVEKRLEDLMGAKE